VENTWLPAAALKPGDDMRILTIALCSLLIPVAAFSQAGNGTITGTITDATGASIANASVQVANTETGTVFSAVSTQTGNYAAPSLQPGPYSISVAVNGFKKYTRNGVTLAVAQTLNIDIPLEVGANTDVITVSAEATLLQTETGDVAANITHEQLADLPMLGIGNANAGSSGVRNPYSSVLVLPGVSYTANSVMIVNGAPSNTAAYRLEGMDNTNHTVSFALQENQPSADAIQEVAIQTSNYAPEFGQAGGGLFNITMRSGTNAFHGSAYEYFVNEDLNAAAPFSNDGSGHKIRPRNRRNDFGGTVGGPVWIPKVYNGKNKTFFFFSTETFREASGLSFNDIVPTAPYRNGDFSAISPNGGAGFNSSLGVPSGSLGVDALGRPIFANEIYDPTTRGTTAAGAGFANPFTNNIIPTSRITPFAAAVQALIPAPQNGGFTNNYTGTNLSQRISKIPSIKIDHSLGDKNKFSFYWSTTGTDSQYSSPNGNADGLPELLTGARGTFIHSLTERLNYDRVLTPTLLLHIGAGYSRIRFIDDGPFTTNGGKFDCAKIDLPGCQASFNFPTFVSMVGLTTTQPLGGMQQMGNAQAHTHTNTERPAFNANASWIHSNHTFKFGSEVWIQGNITAPPSGVSLTFGTNGTAQPYTVPAGLAGQNMGFPYASFLLGDFNAASQIAPNDVRMGKIQWAFFAQDSWKVTRKLTVDYGLRWDYATVPHEQYGRSADLGATTPNPSVGNRLGAPIFEATCNCSFVQPYKFAYGPRLGVAYQVNPKTVIRGGWGLVYGFAPDIGASTASNQTNTPVGINAFANVSAPGALPQPVWPNLSPGQSPLPGQITGFTGFTALDRNAARPPRQNQWSIGMQRELTRDFVLEASYVGNRGVWWAGPLGYINQVSPAAFAAFGLDPFHNPADNLLLSQPISTPAIAAKLNGFLPYPGYSTTNTLINALRPFPQFSTIAVTGSPTGKTWYDSLQVKANKRMSKGLQVGGTFTWSKALVFTRQDLFNAASSTKSIESTDQPLVLSINMLYQTQKYFDNRLVTLITKDWQFGGFVNYASGLPLTPPASTATNNLPGGSEQIRTGQPLYLKDLNCGCINPYTDQVLNPAAWTNQPSGTYGPGPSPGLLPGLLYTDFRGARRPSESFNIGRNFKLGKAERPIVLSVRAEFANIFNRTQIGNPVTTNPATGLTHDPVTGHITGGFGGINEVFAKGSTVTTFGNASQLFVSPRQGTLVARITF
jgi:Carboxypeptidase regulatory-like domain/TonB dependent receptor